MENSVNEQPVKKTYTARKLVRYSVAVLACVVLAGAAIFGYSFYRLSSNRVFSNYYERFVTDSVRKINPLENLIDKSYANGNYKEVTMLADSSGKEQDILLSSLCWIELNNNSKAIDGFRKLLAGSGSPVIKEHTEFYLSLVYIRNKDFDQALELLHNIHDDPAHRYNKKISAKLLRKVRMLKWR